MEVRTVGRYAIFDEIAHGGMATVHIGRLRGAQGFARTVAIKRLHPQYAKDPAFVKMLVDEAHLAARIRHPNVVPTLDVVSGGGEVFLVMDYVFGETMSRLMVQTIHQQAPMPVSVATAVMVDVLHGLHAAHVATNERAEPMGIVHRDVSPQNILLGVDGVARVFDFGVAKAAQRMQTTHDGSLKGKIGYMSPEQLHGQPVDCRADIYAAGVVFWEFVVGTRLFASSEGQPALLMNLKAEVEPPSRKRSGLPSAIDEVVLCAVDPVPERRFQTALEMARALEISVGMAAPEEAGAWVRSLVTDALEEKARLIAKVEAYNDVGEGNTAVRQLSELVTQPGLVVPAEQSARRPIWLWLSFALVSVLLLTSVWTLMRRGSKEQSAQIGFAEVTTTVVDRDAAPAGASTAPSSSVVGQGGGAGANEPPVLEISASSLPLVPLIEPSSTQNSRRKVAPRIKATPKPASSCNPPYIVDEFGNKRYNRGCFQ